MKLFLDTADVSAIKQWAQTGLLDGVTTNPTHLSNAGGDPKKHIADIIALLPDGDISVEITQKDPQKVYEQAKTIAALGKNIVVKIPCHIDYYPIIKQLVSEGIALNITLVFSVIQGMLMAKLGVKYISPFVGRLDDIGQDGVGLLNELRHALDMYGFNTQILAASLRNVEHAQEAMLAGSDVLTLPVSVLKEMVQHDLTDKGMKKFDEDWQKLGIKQFP